MLAVLWFFRELFLGDLFCFGDLTYYFYPYRYFMAQLVRHGALPLWNPLIQMGFPFLATLQTGFYYPLSVIYYLFPFDQAFNWFLVVHYALGAYFMYLLGRELEQSVPAAAGAGLVFAFSGYLASVLHMPTTLASVVWLPLVFLFFRRSLAPDDRLKNLAATGVFLALMFLGGEPTVFYGTVCCLLVYLAYRRQPAGGVVLAGAVGLAAGITAVQLLPFAELLSHSVRGAGLGYEEVVKYSIPLHKMTGLFLPLAGRSPWLDGGWLKDLYLGLVPAGLALLALVRMPARQRWWLGGALLLILLIAAGSYSPLPVYRLLYAVVPGFNLFRYPAKFLFVFVFLFAYLSGRGLDLLAGRAWVRAGLAVLILADLYLFNSGVNFSIAANRYHAVPENVRLLAADRSEFRYFIAPDAFSKCRYEDKREFSDWGRALLSLRNRLTYNQNMIFGLAALDGYE